VSIQLTESFGEPLITSQFDWQAGSNTPPDCLPKQLDLWIEWQSNDDRIAYMPITVKTSPSGISGEERLSSPTWSRFICQTKVYTASCFDQQTAQRFIGSNPYAVSFEVAQWATVAEASIEEAPQRGRPKIDFGIQLEDRLNQSIDNLLTGKDSPDDEGATRDSKKTDSLSSVSGLASAINHRLAGYEMNAFDCQGSAIYSATRISECRLILQADTTWGQCQGQTSLPGSRQQVEIDFSQRGVKRTEVVSRGLHASLLISLAEPAVVSANQAINLFVLSSKLKEQQLLEDLGRGITTVQELCSLGKQS